MKKEKLTRDLITARYIKHRDAVLNNGEPSVVEPFTDITRKNLDEENLILLELIHWESPCTWILKSDSDIHKLNRRLRHVANDMILEESSWRIVQAEHREFLNIQWIKKYLEVWKDSKLRCDCMVHCESTLRSFYPKELHDPNFCLICRGEHEREKECPYI